jgi:hypothetical protein
VRAPILQLPEEEPMGKAVWLPFAAILLQAATPGPGCLPPDQAAERMDEYFANPRAPATYRALAGLGDPRIERFSYDHYQQQHPLFGPRDDWEGDEALRRRLFPVERTEMGGSEYVSTEGGSCRAGYALAVARERIAALGAEHPYVEQWFAVQRSVFSACAGRGPPRLVPPPPPLAAADPAVARLQRDDRAYQSASRLFYEESPAAAPAFRRIAASASGHAPIARYMLLVLKVERPAAPVAPPPPSAREQDQGPPPIVSGDLAQPAKPRPDVPAIIAEADRILADPKLARIHPLVQGLIGSLTWNSARDYDRREGDPPNPHVPLLYRAQVRLTLAALRLPIERLRTDPVARELYARAAEDVGGLHGKFADPAWWLTGLIPEDAHGSRAMAATARSDRFAAWLLYPASPFRAMAWGRAGRALDWDSRLHWITNDGHSRDQLAWRAVSESVSMGEGGWSVVDEMAAKARRCADEDATLAALPELYYHAVRRSLTYRRDPRADHASFTAALDHMAAWPWRESEHHRETVAAALRYLIEAGRIRDARKLRDRLLTAAAPAGNRYDASLLLLAEDEARFVAALAAEGGGDREPLLNMLSSAALHRLVERPGLAAADRARFARVAWTRLYALGRPVPAKLDRLMRRLNPEIAGRWRSRPGRRAKAGDRRLLLDVLRSPGLNILITHHQRPSGGWQGEDPGFTGIDTFQHSDNNWWCAWQPERHEAALDDLLYRQFFSGPAEDDDPDPLQVAGARRMLSPLLEASWLWARRDSAQEQALSQIPCAPRLLAERAIAWGGPGIGGQDEALALAVRATRYGCQRQGGHGAYSRAAFALLHRLYPESAAAKRTRYWFDCAHFSGGCRVPADAAEMD